MTAKKELSPRGQGLRSIGNILIVLAIAAIVVGGGVMMASMDEFGPNFAAGFVGAGVFLVLYGFGHFFKARAETYPRRERGDA